MWLNIVIYYEKPREPVNAGCGRNTANDKKLRNLKFYANIVLNML